MSERLKTERKTEKNSCLVPRGSEELDNSKAFTCTVCLIYVFCCCSLPRWLTSWLLGWLDHELIGWTDETLTDLTWHLTLTHTDKKLFAALWGSLLTSCLFMVDNQLFLVKFCIFVIWSHSISPCFCGLSSLVYISVYDTDYFKWPKPSWAFLLKCWCVCATLQLHSQNASWRWGFYTTVLSFFMNFSWVEANKCWTIITFTEITATHKREKTSEEMVCMTIEQIEKDGRVRFLCLSRL